MFCIEKLFLYFLKPFLDGVEHFHKGKIILSCRNAKMCIHNCIPVALFETYKLNDILIFLVYSKQNKFNQLILHIFIIK